MNNIFLGKRIFLLVLGTTMVSPINLPAQESGAAASSSTIPVTVPSSALEKMENMNLLGADMRMPAFSDTIFGTDSAFRRSLYSKGFVLRDNLALTYTQNALDPPVPADQVTYSGQRPYERVMSTPILTYDLRALHIPNAQLYIGSALLWVNWEPAGPTAVTVSSLYFYKQYAKGHVETKIGYVNNDYEFLGLQVGGSLSTAGPGVYAVLPYEVGLSRFPLSSPTFNLKLNGPKQLYFKTAVQRSLDSGGGTTTIGRNEAGTRFIPKGDKLVNAFEVGYNHPATVDFRQTWVRAGYIHNTTGYTNLRTGAISSGNYCVYILADRQLRLSGGDRPKRGVYTGVSAMTVSPQLNKYAHYYELRVYDMGPFNHRGDTVSFVASHTDYSRYATTGQAVQGKTFWRGSTSFTGSYNLQVTRGQYVNVGFSYLAGPDITPRAPNALNFSAIYNFFF